MQRALEDLKRLARDRDLEQAYASELFGLEHQVQAAVDAHARGLAEHAAEAVRRMTHEVLHAPSRSDGSGPADPPGPGSGARPRCGD